MTTITQTYAKHTSRNTLSSTYERTGGPRGSGSMERPDELVDYLTTGTPFGSHMPLDTQMHWNWSNPLNIIPAFIALLFVLMVIGLIIG